MVRAPYCTPKLLAKRKPKAFRDFPYRNKVGLEIYIERELVAQLNEAWLQSDCPFFSRWVAGKLKEALK